MSSQEVTSVSRGIVGGANALKDMSRVQRLNIGEPAEGRGQRFNEVNADVNLRKSVGSASRVLANGMDHVGVCTRDSTPGRRCCSPWEVEQRCAIKESLNRRFSVSFLPCIVVSPFQLLTTPGISFVALSSFSKDSHP